MICAGAFSANRQTRNTPLRKTCRRAPLGHKKTDKEKQEAGRIVEDFLHECPLPSAMQIIEWRRRYPQAANEITDAAIISLNLALYRGEGDNKANEQDIALVLKVLTGIARKLAAGRGRARGDGL